MLKEITNRKETTSFLSKLLEKDKLVGLGKYYASEVTLDYGHGKGKQKRIDYIQFIPANQYSVSGLEKGEFVCYEIKSCKEDVTSGHGLNFEGERNYIVTTMDTWKKIIQSEQQGNKLIPHYVGVLVACIKDIKDEFDSPTPLHESDQWRLEVARPAHRKHRERSITELLFCMLRSSNK